jgi:hypothetical protein
VVAHATVAKDGTYDTRAPLPPAALRAGNDTRYRAVLGADRSHNLKLRRRLHVSPMVNRNGRIIIVGRVTLPLSHPVNQVELRQRVTCKRDKVVARFRPHSDGTFRISVKAPKGPGAAVYRLQTLVRNRTGGHSESPTFTLPQAVALHR